MQLPNCMPFMIDNVIIIQKNRMTIIFRLLSVYSLGVSFDSANLIPELL